MKERKNIINLLFIILIILVGFISITWFKGDFLINKNDFDFSVNPNQDLPRYFYTWDDNVGLGLDNTRAIAKLFPYQVFINFSTDVGISLVTTEKILFYLLFTSSGIFMYFLLHYVLKEKKYCEFAALSGALFYMMNMWVAEFRWSILLVLPLFIYAVLPLLFMYFIIGLEKRDYKYAIYLAFASLLAAPAANNPIYYFPFIVIFLIYSVYFIITKIRDVPAIKFLLKFTIISVIMFSLVNFWWIVRPLSAVQEAKHTVQTKYDPYSQIKLESRDASLSSLARMVGNWALKDDYKGDPYYTYGDLYNKKSFTILGYVIAIIAFLGLFTNNKYKWFFALIMIIGIFLSKGSHEPLGYIYLWLYDNVPGFWVFRSPYEKHGILIAFGMASMIAIFLLGLFNYFEKKQSPKFFVNILGVMFVLFISVIYAWPYWNGEIIYPGGKIMPSARIKIPDYYQKLQNYLSQKKISRLFDLPVGNSFIAGPCPFKWGYFGGDPLPHFISDSNILLAQPATYGDNKDYDFNKAIANKLQVKGGTEKLLTDYKLFLYLTDSRYLLLRNDIDWNFYGTSETAKESEYSLSKDNEVKSVEQFGDLHLYRLENNNYPEFIYSPEKTYYYQGSLDGLRSLDSLYPDLGKNGVFINNTSASNYLDEKNEGSSDLSNKKIINLYPDPSNLIKEDDRYKTKVNIDKKLLANYNIYAELNDSDRNSDYIKINNNKIQLPVDESSENWSNIGEININNREIKTDFFPIVKNVLHEDFLETESLWQLIDASVNSNGEGKISNEIVDGGNGSTAMSIVSENHLAGARKKIEGLDPEKIYSLSFSYKNESGQAPKYSIEALDKNPDISLGMLKEETLDSGKEWQTYTAFFQPKSSVIFIYFYSDSTSELTSNFYDDINIDELTLPMKSLVIASGDDEQITKKEPIVNFTKINPTKYEVNITGAKSAYYLNFLASYNVNWQASIIDSHGTKKIVSEENHFALNGYANSWKIDTPGDYKIVIEYKPQKYFYTGLVISSTGILVLCIWIIINKRKTKSHV